MGIKWDDIEFNKTPIDAREKYKSEGGWWSTLDIINYLIQKNISIEVIQLSTMDNLKTVLDYGDIAILCIDMYYISYNPNPKLHTDAFSYYREIGSGHFIVIKGYMIVDGKLWFEAYDPASLGRTYSEGTPLGKNRYYSIENLDDATNNWWDYATVISKKNEKSISKYSALETVDPDEIEHMTGM